MDFDWKKTLPFIGALATGGVPALVGAAASAIGEALGTTVEATPEAIDKAVKGATPEQMIALTAANNQLKIRMRELDTEDKRIDAQTEVAYIDDVKDARKFNADTHGILILGYIINLTSYICIALVLWGCFNLMSAGDKLTIDPGTAAMLGGIIGAAVQWIMSNAAQANGFFFGSSPGSRTATTDLAKAVGGAVTKLPTRRP